MKKGIAALLAGACLALAGCAELGGAGGKPALSLEAQTALLQAEQDIKFADGQKRNTAPAKALYQKAQEAAAAGDEKAALKHAKEASTAAIKAK